MVEGLKAERNNVKEEVGNLTSTVANQARRIEDLTTELTKEREAAKVADDLRATEALNQAKKESDTSLVSVAFSHSLATQKTREFLKSSQSESKFSSECAAYFATLAIDHKERFPDLITLFNEEKAGKPDWYDDLTLEGDDDAGEEESEGEEGGVDSSPAP
ncbi:hypothetical protein LIER_31449 [Lithospermum erythrorhizon]|uniref:Uncharacterized protein n=1 Tax=Lithospermum erythrorhizon TaxID=34254 RepID=A0AAV3RUK5_LITER